MQVSVCLCTTITPSLPSASPCRYLLLPPPVVSQLSAALQVKANPHVLTCTYHKAFMAIAVRGCDSVCGVHVVQPTFNSSILSFCFPAFVGRQKRHLKAQVVRLCSGSLNVHFILEE